MKLEYENTLEDLVAFNRHHQEHSPAARRARALARWVWPLMFVVMGGVAGAAAMEPELFVFGIAAGLVAAIWWAFMWPDSYQRSIERQVRRMYREGANKGVIGPHELELTADELVERTPFGETRTRFAAIERIVSDSGYTFIYVSAVGAHCIPHHALSKGDHEAFIAALKQRLSASISGQGEQPAS